MVVIAGGGTPPPRPSPPGGAPSDPRAAGIAAVNRSRGGNPAAPPGWDELAPDEQRRVVELFNMQYGDLERRPGGYSVTGSAAFFANPILKRPGVWESLVAAATPFSTKYETPLQQEKMTGRLQGLLYPQGRAEVDQRGVTTAVGIEGASANYMKQIVGAAARHGVPWQVLWGLIRAESNFKNVTSKNKNGTVDHGVVQINSIHLSPSPNASLTRAQAMDPATAIDWAARKLKEGFSAYGDWGLATLNYHRPRSAKTLFDTGKSEAGWSVHDKDYIGKVFAGIDKLGFSGDDAKLDLIGQEGGGGPTPPKFSMPDPVAVKQSTAEYLRKLFFREPTEAELAGAVDLISGLVGQANAEAAQYGPAAAPNPFRTPDEAGGDLQHPLAGARKTSGFGPRVHPVHGQQKQHDGVDWSAAEGTPFKAAVSGKVTFAGKKGGYGNIIIVQGSDGREYRYAHLSRLGASTGDEVIAGAVIGNVGQTGTATGPHLHFEIRQGGKAIDPETVFAADEHSPAPAPMGAGAVQAPGAPPVQYDHQARLAEQVKGMPEYQQLYGKKPAGVSEEEYAASFASMGTEMLGQGAPGANEAIRAGLASGTAATTAGVIAGDARSMENKTFRQRMFEAAEAFNRLL